jgi:L-ascorbate metabolism protein UlaG (beta-lactamase superfamily)
MKITYLSHSCFLVEHNNYKVIIDPFLSSNPSAKVSPEEINVDAVLITHGHSDHVGDAISIAKRNNCKIVAGFELAMHLAKSDVEVHPLGIGGSFKFEWGKVKLTKAFHGSGIETEMGEFLYGGMPAGILLSMGEETFYHAGDTDLFYDMKLIGDLNNIDIAALPIGDNFTMGPEDATIAATWLKAKQYIPMHYDTFDLIKQDPVEWKNQMALKNLEVVVMSSGDVITIN